MNKKKVREVALDVLLQIEKSQAYSNLLLNQVIKKEKLNEKDVGLLTEIVYGTLQRKNTLDFYLHSFVRQGLKKLDQWVLVLLRLSVYQLVYLDRVPERAIVHEAVEIAKRKGHKGIAATVNGVLRSIIRQGIPAIETVETVEEQLAIQWSQPVWLIKRWLNQFGLEKTKEICEVSLRPPLVTARINRCSGLDCLEVIALLQEEDVIAESGDLSPDAVKIRKGSLPNTKLYQEGVLTIQDESSMLVAGALAPEPGMNVLDSCAAPGGKTTHLAERMNNQGKIIALDLHEHKIKLINEQAKRLNLSIIQSMALDSRKVATIYEESSFDAILVDAPCTGLGVIRRKPDLKWQKQLEDIEKIAVVQKEILAAVAPLLKQGGRLVYSTCTIDAVENQLMIENFLNEHENFQLDRTLTERLPESVAEQCNNGMLQILPSDFQTDGFFIASMVKIE